MKTKLVVFTPLLILFLLSFACQSTGPIGNLFASPTPTFTITPSPTVTPSPTPTKTPTPTPLPTGVQFESLPSGNTKIIDYDNGYSLLLSEDWLPISDNEEIFKQALEFASDNNPELSDTLDNFKEVFNDETLRLIAFNIDEKYRDKKNFPNILILAISDPLISSLPLELLIEINVEQLGTEVPSAKIEKSGIAKNKNNIEYGYIYLDSATLVDGLSVKIYQNVLIFKVDDTMLLFSLTTPASKKDVVGELLQELIDSIELFNTFPTLNG